jgi:CRISPR-associated endonuclease Cas3-HD
MADTDMQLARSIAVLSDAVRHQWAHALYAHSKENTAQELWHSLEAHLRDTAEKAREFAQPWGAGDWVWNAAWLHDLGKADSRFQGYLLRENGLDDTEYDQGRVNHSSAGAACAEDRLKQPGRVLAYLIAGHHAGLPDWHPAETGNAALQIRLDEGRENLQRISSFAAASSTVAAYFGKGANEGKSNKACAPDPARVLGSARPAARISSRAPGQATSVH